MDYGQRLQRVLNAQELKKELETLNNEFIDAVQHLKPGNRLMYFDSNVCVFIENLNICTPINKTCFVDKIADAKKTQYYKVIKNYYNISKQLYELEYASAHPPKRYIRYFDNGPSDPVLYVTDDRRTVITRAPYPERHYKPIWVRDRFIFNSLRLPVPVEAARFLYNLTGGSPEKLSQFAELCAAVLSEPMASTTPFAILTDKESFAPLISFFESLTCTENILSSRLIKFENDLPPTKQIDLLKAYDCSLNGFCAILVSEGKIPRADKRPTRLNSLIHGRKIDINPKRSVTRHLRTDREFNCYKISRSNNPRIQMPCFDDTIHIVNSLPFIFLTSDENKLEQLNKTFGAFRIRLLGASVNQIFFFEHIREWFKVPFALLGLKCFAGFKIKQKPASANGAVEDTVKAFLRDVCIVDKTSPELKCRIQEVYEAFDKYVRAKFNISPMSTRLLSQKLKDLKIEKDQFHSSTHSNSYYFFGMTVDREKLEAVVQSASSPARPKDAPGTNFDDFFNMLRSATDFSSEPLEVTNYSPDFPPVPYQYSPM